MNLQVAMRYALGRSRHDGNPSIPGELTPEIEAWVTEFGREYKPANLPADIDRGPVGTCFDSCLMNLLMNNKYQYVEGKAFDGIKWYYHSWLTDGTRAFDPTWQVIGKGGVENPNSPFRYFGFVIPTGFLMFFNFKTHYAGVLGNRNRYTAAVDKLLEHKREEAKA